ncbi:unnamed protein product [Polarella glacialis]|uniref:EF-hand domain-containing protein n=1 Tax=Polarella glacialis TaxID=89957 RepID=A0A813D0Q4_POLGL|nr:unnamed protein product [Polarella glacialis]|mmetsp:Transcript_63793/g.103337  ORF Transcript_63793/g.103337 Transcript_63793/m.103337 type:complete len:166 (+) Transcript_63793:63-560(+)|eukprot:CAMPEP_0115092258 /NCGR_PEP_ID=MMETSP0227-20121206/26646_1 /TAXON_ID=89957 /ORGANISM="Polarella glacialis, Strain CCMP 1383" /LENGTH=165 /DNA_ID=CAMNT_0002484017 /DNA_START=56 /DNA_END=553 /DNA_ORIENTATION=+
MPKKKLPPIKDDSLSKLMAAFQALDQDGSGEVSRDELSEKLKGQLSEKDKDALMNAFDTDGNGRLNYTEFRKLEKLLETFRRFDEDHSGEISREELTKVMQRLQPDFSNQDLTDLMSEIDKDSNGGINYSEFIMWMGDFSDELGIQMEAAVEIMSRASAPAKDLD